MKKNNRKLYAVSNAHLDTQWNWTVRETIAECIPSTLLKNFELMDKYPSYRMNFEGAFRYKLAKEYYPDLYERLKEYIKNDRWNVSGSTWDAMDANIPSSEALMRQVLLGNGFFEREFSKRSSDIFLADCFGFRYALPSVAAHMGLSGFSTQKLVWGVGAPIIHTDGSVSEPQPSRVNARMDLGKWVGPDGKGVYASLLEGNYTYNFDDDGNTTPIYKRREYLEDIENNEKYSGTAKRSMYFGTGDYGGSCKESSARMLQEAIEKNGSDESLFDVVSASTDQIFLELTDEEKAALPVYDGGLLIPHGYGAMTSHTISKRWNRKNELLADSAERAAILAGCFAGIRYPEEKLKTAWETFLWHQFHDDLPGTSIGEAYRITYNDYIIALNIFAAELTGSVRALLETMDTDVQGIPVAVYNPLSFENCDAVSAELPDYFKGKYARVISPEGNEVPCQLEEKNGKRYVVFTPEVKGISLSVFDVRESVRPYAEKLVFAGCSGLENEKVRVTIDENGDISSIYDKCSDKELLSSPVRFTVGEDNNTVWPSWELKYEDMFLKQEYVSGKPEITVLDGESQASITVKRKFRDSIFTSEISLSAKSSRVDIKCRVDWYERSTLLRMVFPLTVSAKTAEFDQGLGAATGENTTSHPYFQHNVHEWADLTDSSGDYGVCIMNDCKYGMEKPNDNTLSVTLIHTPKGDYSPESRQDFQDIGRNEFTLSIEGHKGKRLGMAASARKLNQPCMTFITDKHSGRDKELSFLKISNDGVAVRCLKKEETGSRIILRIQETEGLSHENVKIEFCGKIVSACETNGFEEDIAEASFKDDTLFCKMDKYQVRTFAIVLDDDCKMEYNKEEYTPISLDYDRKVTSSDAVRGGGLTDDISIPGELFTSGIYCGGIPFLLGDKNGKNAVTARGQTIDIPENCGKISLIMTSVCGDRNVTLKIGDRTEVVTIQDAFDDVGSWDLPVCRMSCLIKRNDIAQCYTHTHGIGGDRYYRLAYLYCHTFETGGANSITLPDDCNILIFAASAGSSANKVYPACELYDSADSCDDTEYEVVANGCSGGGKYKKGTVVLIYADELNDDGLFTGFESNGEGLIVCEDNLAAVRVSGNITLTAKRKLLGEDVISGRKCVSGGKAFEHEEPENALNGNCIDKWCARPDENGVQYLEIELDKPETIGSYIVIHCGKYESQAWNTRNFEIQYRTDECGEWLTADRVEGNTEDITYRTFNRVNAKFIRLYITAPTQGRDQNCRIYSFKVFKA